MPAGSTDIESRFARGHLDIDPEDPLISVLEHAGAPVDVDGLDVQSPALSALREAGTKLIVPLMSADGMVGLLALDSPRGRQSYGDRSKLWLTQWSSRAATALRLAQLVELRRAEGQRRQRELHDLEVARLVQHRLLPDGPCVRDEWQVSPYYSTAESIGGDFYDFIDLPSGELAVVAGDVAGKGISGALGMASVRSLIRQTVRESRSPAEVLRAVNDALVTDLPDGMFVTCAYFVLCPSDGRVVCANAGHNPPMLLHSGVAQEVDVRGMPLGMMPGSDYQDVEMLMDINDVLFVYSDGLLEARSHGEMFGRMGVFRLLQGEDPRSGQHLVDHVVDALLQFTGREWEQDDDITLLAIMRTTGGEDGRK